MQVRYGDKSSASKPRPRRFDMVMRSAPETTWGERHKSLVLACKATSERSIMIGDSLIHRLESKHPHIAFKYFNDYLNLGFGGDCTENVLWRINNGGIPPKVNTAIILCATNNLTKRPPDNPMEIAEAVCKIGDAILKKSNARNVIIVGLLPRRGQDTNVVNILLEELCRARSLTFMPPPD